MQKRKTSASRKSKTKIIPPKSKKTENLSRDEIRFMNKKRIRRKRKLKRLCTLALLFLLIAGVGLALVLTLFFKIETVQVKGAKVYAQKEILEKSNIEIGDNLFSVSEKTLNEVLPKSLPFIKSVDVERKLPDTLIINVTATKEIAALEKGSGYILIDETGKILDKDGSNLREGVAVVSGVSPVKAEEGEKISLKTEELTNTFITALQSIKNSDFKLVTELIMEKNGEVSMMYDDRIKVKLGSTVNIDKKIQRAKAAIDKENEINPYTEGVLDLKTEPYAYFSAGKEEDETKSAKKDTDKAKETSSTTKKGG